MSTDPRVSVVMPCYNHEAFVEAAMASVLDQAYRDLELIVLDDASADDSVARIQARAAADPRVRVVVHDENRGIARTFNEGLALARGRWTGLIASDDLWLPGKLESQVAILEAEPDVVVWCEGRIIDGDGGDTGELFTESYGAADRPKEGHLLVPFLKGYYLFFSGLMAATGSLRDPGFDESMAYLNDYKLALELARRHRFVFQDQPLACHRGHDDNASAMGDRDGWRADGEVFRRYLEAEHGGWIRADREIRQYLAGFLRHLASL